jgi:aromatic ring-cleaving dioxygenase
VLESLTAADFRPHVGQRHRLVAGDGRAVAVVLAQVMERQGAPGFRTPFALHFASEEEGPFLPQGIHRLERRGARALDIFIVPVGPDPVTRRMTYEAIFA